MFIGFFVMVAAASSADFLEPEKAFVLSASTAGSDTVELRFAVADGYYLYRDRLAFVANEATLAHPELPAGKTKFDENLQKQVETYRHELVVRLKVKQAGPSFDLAVTSQGCADAGLCYPPLTRHFVVSLTAFGGGGRASLVDESMPRAPAAVQEFPAAERGTDLSTAASGAAQAAHAFSPGPASVAEAVPGHAGASTPDNAVERALRGGSWWTVIGVFWFMGLLLSFTPCVLPMMPILSSIIAGGGSVTRRRGLTLALAYTLGVACVYTGLGIAAGLAGEGLAAAMQKPWVLALFGLMLAAFSLSMFDVYELRLPLALSNRLDTVSRRLPGGRLFGVFLMGGLSALIVSPCVTAPLASALVVLSQTRDVALAGTALFSMAVGMSAPLLLLGASAGAWLPRSGAWMHAVKRFFGVLLLAVAWWIVQPVLPAWAVLGGWGALLLLTGFMLRPFDASPHSGSPRVWLQRAAGLAALAWGVMEFAGAASGGRDALQPLAQLAGHNEPGVRTTLPFRLVRSPEELDALLAHAGKPVMLDFYADWCVSCKEMERTTFADPAVGQRLSSALLLKADVTANAPDDKALLRRFNLFGPPGTIFFDARGRELPELRVIGFKNTSDFEKTLTAAGL